MAKPNDDVRACLYDAHQKRDGSWQLSCYRPALLGRLLCHKHAGYKTRKIRRRRRNKIARATRKAQRA